MANPTHERLKSLLHYEPATGVFTWLARRPNGVKVGDEAGTINVQGYRSIKVDGRGYSASNLAWLYMTGQWPAFIIDHADTLKTNNSWGNLRQATHAQNIQNRPVQRNSRSGLKGVHFKADKTSFKKWAALIRIDGKLKTLGYFQYPEQAHAAYHTAAVAAFGEFARS